MAVDESVLTPNDLRAASGLTPRQVNDWDARGALPSDRVSERGHRRFTPQQVFAISVCAALKRQMGIPVERLQFVRDWLLPADAEVTDSDMLNYSARLMAERGVAVWLVTDFTETVLILTEMELADIWDAGFFGADRESFAFLNLNPIINKILTAIGRSPIEAHERYRDLVRALREHHQAHMDGERELLAMIRSGEYRSVEVTTRDGKVHRITSERERPRNANLRDLAREAPFQKFEVTTQHGAVVGITQKVTKRPGEGRRGK